LTITTERLRLRRPELADAGQILESYAGDPEVTRYLSWPRHTGLQDTEAFIAFSDQQWQAWQTGPLVVELLDNDKIIGSTGLGLETPYRASTGYVFARDHWGQGYATEALTAVMDLAHSMNLWRVDALCHWEHVDSAKVLEKGGFVLEGTLRRHTLFPNLHLGEPQDVLLYALVLR
jgi:RimJ/RimL family protein N-acetyltransferase